MAIYGKFGYRFDKARATVEISQNELHGKITANTLTPLVGETVKLTASMQNGYVLKNYQVNTKTITGTSFSAVAGVNTVVPIEVKVSTLPQLKAPTLELSKNVSYQLSVIFNNPNDVPVYININGYRYSVEAKGRYVKTYSWQNNEKSLTYSASCLPTNDYLSTYSSSEVVSRTYIRSYDNISLSAPTVSITKEKVSSGSYQVIATFKNTTAYDCVLAYSTTGSIVLSGSVDITKNSTYELNLGTFANATGTVSGHLTYNQSVSSSNASATYTVGNYAVVGPRIEYEEYGNINEYQFTIFQVDSDASVMYYQYDQSGYWMRTTNSKVSFLIENDSYTSEKSVRVKAYTVNSKDEESTVSVLDLDIPKKPAYISNPVLNNVSADFEMTSQLEGIIYTQVKITNNSPVDVVAHLTYSYNGGGQMSDYETTLDITSGNSKYSSPILNVSQPYSGDILNIDCYFTYAGLTSSTVSVQATVRERE